LDFSGTPRAILPDGRFQRETGVFLSAPRRGTFPVALSFILPMQEF
jgi:hypothetical protein